LPQRIVLGDEVQVVLQAQYAEDAGEDRETYGGFTALQPTDREA